MALLAQREVRGGSVVFQNLVLDTVVNERFHVGFGT